MSEHDPAHRLLVDRHDLTRVRTDDEPAASRGLSAGEVRVRVDRFAITANNVTYAAFGDSMRYWEFWPSGVDGWGIVPVWGFADVVESTVDGLPLGERLYGFWPMASHAIVRPERLGAHGFVDGTAHRAGLPSIYNQVQRCAATAAWSRALEAHQALLQPLFVTAFLIDDFLSANDFFGAERVLLSSASSKTALATAFFLAQRRDSPAAAQVVGLTSTGRVDEVGRTGLFDDVIDYPAVARLPADRAAVYVDFSGDAALRRTVHERLGDRLMHSASVGGTHWRGLGRASDLPGPRPTLFFAPAHAEARCAPPPAGWGADGFRHRVARRWAAFVDAVRASEPPWLVVREARGADAVARAWATVRDGTGVAADGWMAGFGP